MLSDELRHAVGLLGETSVGEERGFSGDGRESLQAVMPSGSVRGKGEGRIR